MKAYKFAGIVRVELSIEEAEHIANNPPITSASVLRLALNPLMVDKVERVDVKVIGEGT